VGGYELKGGQYILRASDTINDAVNLWGDGNGAVTEAWLEFDALSEYGERARLEYEKVRGEALQSLYQAQNALIAVREALSDVATGYQCH
jgi:hypothetical protein